MGNLAAADELVAGVFTLHFPTGGSAVFESVNTGATVSADGWVTLTGKYSFQAASSGLILYVESTSATASSNASLFGAPISVSSWASLPPGSRSPGQRWLSIGSRMGGSQNAGSRQISSAWPCRQVRPPRPGVS